MTVTNSDIKRWGSYTDRKNSYDDDDDIIEFIKLCKKEDQSLREYLKSYLPDESLVFKPKMNGKYGVDLSITTKDRKVCATIDIER